MSRRERGGCAAGEYHSKDFEWDQLRQEIESDPLLSHHVDNINFNINIIFDQISNTNNNIINALSNSEAWNQFHTRHSTGKFFKERRYILKEFPELLSCDKHAKVLEVGCGNGSTVLPILRGNESINVYACDCSIEALKRTEDMINAAGLVTAKDRFHPFICNFSVCGFPNWLASNSCSNGLLKKQENTLSDVKGMNGQELKEPSAVVDFNCCPGWVDFVTLIFTLSAVPLHRMPSAIAACFAVLRPGGLLLFRDYGLYDMTMLRFGREKKLGFREYARSDGTRSYFFSLDVVKDLFLRAGFAEVELEYCCVKSVNHRSGKIMRRVWVHGKFQKPI